jgi:hypothetical protein
MIKILICSIFSLSILFSSEISLLKQQNVLYIQNIIKIEEKIAKEYEQYLLNEYKEPSLSDLKVDKYLGFNFSFMNNLGPDRILKSIAESPDTIKLNYAITKTYHESKELESYKNALYKRALYRKQTSVYDDIDPDNSFVSIELISKKAKNIFAILSNTDSKRNSIQLECKNTLKNTYCIDKRNTNRIRWYNEDNHWIEYDLEQFTNGNILVSNEIMFLDNAIKVDQKVGTFIHIINDSKYIKIKNSVNSVLKVR